MIHTTRIINALYTNYQFTIEDILHNDIDKLANYTTSIGDGGSITLKDIVIAKCEVDEHNLPIKNTNNIDHI